MKEGIMWLDTSKMTLKQKIQQATEYYQKKYNRTPDLVLVHPSGLDGTQAEITTLTVRPYRPVLPGHLWLGIEDTTEPKA